MLIERPQWVIGLVAAVLILGGIGFAVVTTGSSVLVSGTRVRAEFTDASGLKSGDFVFVSGVRAGEVTSVTQVPQSENPDFADRGPVVVAEFAMNTGARVPADSHIEIVLSNTLGKRGIAVMPTDNSVAHVDKVGELEDGAYVTLEQTDTLVDLPEFGQDTTDLLEELDVEALKSLTGSLADITQDQRGDVDRLFEGVQKISDVLVNRREQLGRTLDRAEALVDVAESRDDQVIEIIDNFQVTLDTLLAKQDEIERLLDETANTSTVAADFVTERRAQIDRVVADLTTTLDVVDAHQVDLAHTLPYLAVGLEGFASIGYLNAEKEDTGQWGNVFTTGLGAVGIEATLGCGSAFDDAMTQLLGPDPSCDGYDQTPGPDNPTQDPGPGEETDNDGSGPAAPTSALDAVFGQGLRLGALAPTEEGAR